MISPLVDVKHIELLAVRLEGGFTKRIDVFKVWVIFQENRLYAKIFAMNII